MEAYLKRKFMFVHFYTLLE